MRADAIIAARCHYYAMPLRAMSARCCAIRAMSALLMRYYFITRELLR